MEDTHPDVRWDGDRRHDRGCCDGRGGLGRRWWTGGKKRWAQLASSSRAPSLDDARDSTLLHGWDHSFPRTNAFVLRASLVTSGQSLHRIVPNLISNCLPKLSYAVRPAGN